MLCSGLVILIPQWSSDKQFFLLLFLLVLLVCVCGWEHFLKQPNRPITYQACLTLSFAIKSLRISMQTCLFGVEHVMLLELELKSLSITVWLELD